MKATQLVHWPSKTTPACEHHAEQLKALASHMSFNVTSTECVQDIECSNCANEAKKNGV